ncbi:hydroxyethylthiazole kinase [Weissella paramesenteroides]|jgi:hydroxyethylthiazole kinase|uniref:PfkB family carbohydrate kinase n=1 Tax=Weissella paramesenteroides TaxID=1249 RepID=UPI00103DF818|nr:PfkB family carbohydrate kinase [Weissella paramesenteroides]KAA8442689.1 hydroxyethylthiazole kinase [Weissella paramesenteroides]KAA8443035.1 hydroxyethylthiazole kinase [Weissella paramesenteroides]KAA8444289.1 hydroxyethylthiazole kinase [Weissella paramesenteroides]KAA8447957.1 hydroxyethylthiazole kinase [Weissella paramesenteroides]KAA8452230.1 hydroxyethylthiazole kinase [Weissella paramesenteroides]
MKKITIPLQTAPLIHCITNAISVETVANALLYIGAKPIMTEDIRAFNDLALQTNSLLLNLGSLSLDKEKSILAASKLAIGKEPVVLDVVGIASAKSAMKVAKKIIADQPTIVRGNISEMRALCDLQTHGRGVDGSLLDQTDEELINLITALKQLPQESIYVATGTKDIVVARNNVWVLSNGVPELDRFTGSGDTLSGLLAALLGEGASPEDAAIQAISYLNIAGETAKSKTVTSGIAEFRQLFLNELSLLGVEDSDWINKIRGTKNDETIIFSDSEI